MKTTLKRARKTASKAAEKSAATEKTATQKTTPKSPAKPASQPAKAAGGSTPSTGATPRLSAKKTTATKMAVKQAAVKRGVVKAKVPRNLFDIAPEKPKVKAGAKAPALRATKKRAPKDLANQYGEVVKVGRASVVESAPRKRRNAAARAKLQAAITPDDGLLLRLARAGAISSSHVAKNGDGDDEKPFRATAKRRSRKWETRCGKCGVNAQYSSSAALCVKCGAILVRD